LYWYFLGGRGGNMNQETPSSHIQLLP
jgi:hypothetical protein